MKRLKGGNLIHERRVGVRWGRALGAINFARQAMATVYSERSLLSKRLQVEIADIHHRLASLEMAMWKEESRSAT